MTLTPRDQKKRQMVRGGYAGVGVGVVVLLLAVNAGSILLGILGIIVLVVAGWATRAIRSL
jgi:uncharacterized membrane protein YccC